MKDITLFYRCSDFAEMGTDGGAAVYDDYVWTARAGSPYAPAADGDGNPRYFSLVKTEPDQLTPAVRREDPTELMYVSLPVDLLEAQLGEDHQVYEPRTLTMQVSLLWDAARFGETKKYLAKNRSRERQKSEINEKLNGRTWKIRRRDDPGYYRIGKVRVTDALQSKRSDLTVTAEVDPWKYETASSMDVWLWDDFSFEDGIIRDRSDYTLELAAGESGTVTVPPREKRTPVWIRASAAASLTVGGAAFSATTDWKKTGWIPTETAQTLTVVNEGDAAVTVEVYYRGASL